MQRILPPSVAKLCLALMCAVLSMSTITAAAQTQTSKDQGWSYPTSKPSTPFDGGDGSESNPYRIRTAQQLANLAWMVNDGEEYKGKYFLMTDDIVLNEGVMSDDGTYNAANASSFKKWTTIGTDGTSGYNYFKGFFDGGGHTVYGFYQNYEYSVYNTLELCGFFGCVYEAIISNLTLSHSYYHSKGYGSNKGPGFFCSVASKSTFSNVHVKNAYFYEYVEESREKHVGGLLGRGTLMEFKDCSFDGKMEIYARSTTTELNIGGIVGYFDSTKDKITGCKTSGSIKVTQSHFGSVSSINVGGIIGRLSSSLTINRCLNEMDIEVHNDTDKSKLCPVFAGGIGGDLEVLQGPIEISQCVNLGNISVGSNDETLDMEGHMLMLSGIANLISKLYPSCSENVHVSDCANYGNIQVKASTLKSEKPEEKLLAAGCCALYTRSFGNVYSHWTRCISVSDNNSLYASGINIRFAPIMGFLDRPGDAKDYIKVVSDCYYYTNIITNLLDVDSRFIAKDQSGFRNTMPFTSANRNNPWTFLTANESKTWAGYAVPYTPFFTMTSLYGSGTEKDPFLITNEKELLMLNSIMANTTGYGRYFRLENDLDMTNMGTFPTIVNGDKGFIGTFDGNGHYINGLRVSRDAMFDRIGKGGVVKNLMLTNFRGNVSDNYNSSIAGFHFGTIEDCSVFGTISSRLSQTSDQSVTAAGIARTVYEGGVIRRCMFKGTLKASPKTSNDKTSTSESIGCEMSGIAHTTYGTVEQCYASFKIEMEEGFNGYIYKQGIGSTRTTQGSGVTPVLRNCAYVCAGTTITVDGATKCTSEADITLDLLGDTKSEGWLKGAYRPVNKHNKHLTVTDHNEQTTYLDLCPDDAWTPNKVYTDTLTQDNAEDRVLQQFKNLALYNPQSHTAYIINLELDRSLSSFDYKPLDGCTATKGATRVTLKKDDALAGAPGHFLLCLPCPLRTADLPAGSWIYRLGYYPANESNADKTVFYLTECDSVAAGVPCHVYIPDCKTGDYTLVSYGNIVTKPQGTAKYGPQGYFTKQTISNAYTGIQPMSDKYYKPEYINYSADATNLKIFAAAATSENHTETQLLNIRRIIDENDPTLNKYLHRLNWFPKTNLYVKRGLVGGQWNTLTLPFRIDDVSTLAERCGEKNSFEVQELSSITTDDGGLVLNFTPVTAMKSGYPYLVKPTYDCAGFDMAGTACTLIEALTPVTVNNDQYEVTMQPYYVPTVLVEGDYFLMDNKFFVVAEGMTVPSLGMRAHFTANAAAAEAMQSARLVFDNGDVTGIDGITRPAATNAAVYDLSGRRVEKPAHGLYIVNGRKVLLP